MNTHLFYFQQLLKKMVFALAAPCLVSISPAQTPPKPASPPARSAWVIDYQYDGPARKNVPATTPTGMGAPVAATAQVKSREYTLNDNIARSITRYDDGKTVTAYIIQGISVRENPQESTDLIVEQLSSAWMIESDFRRSYPGMNWVLPSHYKGIVEYKGNPFHYFQKVHTSESADNTPGNDRQNINISMNAGPDGGGPTLFSPEDRAVWIAADGRPVASKLGGVTATFTHVPTEAVGRITVPERFIAKAQAFLDSLNPKAK